MFANEIGTYKNVVCGLVHNVSDTTNGDGRNIPIPLVSVSAFATVVQAVAQVEITQVYVNKEKIPIEAIYYFPIDSDAAVTHFFAEIEGRKIKGVVKEREEAKAEYENAIENQNTAFMAQENSPEIFKIFVGFLKPGAEVKIVIGYVTEVKYEKPSKALRFFIPTTVAPRYIPSTEKNSNGQDLANMKFSVDSPASLSITVNVTVPGEIESVSSPTHDVKVTDPEKLPEKKNWNKVVVELSKGSILDMDKDFVLLIEPIELFKPRLYSEKLSETDSAAAMLHFIPSFKFNKLKAEFIFVLDRSGSMGGSSIELARKALMMFLSSLPVDCYFNIVGFGSGFEFLFDTSAKYCDESLEKARKHAKSLCADMGGTVILDPLEAIFEMPSVNKYSRQIFLLTDGEVSNVDEVIALAKRNAGRNRVFSLGIGEAASHYLIERVAEVCNGTSAFVTYNEDIDVKIVCQLKEALQPALTDIQVSWEDESGTKQDALSSSVDRARPDQLTENQFQKSFMQFAPPTIYDGRQLTFCTIFTKGFPKSVHVSATSPDGPVNFKIEINDESHIESSGILQSLAASKIIKELEERLCEVGYDNDEIKQRIIEVSCKYGISSQYTSFVGVDEKNDKFSENRVMETRHVPSQIASGWHGYGALNSLLSCSVSNTAGLQNQRRFSMSSLAMAMPVFRKRRPSQIQCCMAQGPLRSLGTTAAEPQAKKSTKKYSISKLLGWKKDKSYSIGSQSFDSYTAADEKSGDVGIGTVHHIVSLQSFDGSFSFDTSFCSAISKNFDELKKEAKKNNWDTTAWATALAMSYLSIKLPDSKDLWDLIYLKSEKWLSTKFPKDMNAILAAAMLVMKT